MSPDIRDIGLSLMLHCYRHVTLSDEDEYEDYDEKIQSISCVCRG